MYFPSAYFRAKARAALKGRWQTALLIALIVSLPALLAQAITAFTGNDPLARLQGIYLAAARDGVLTQQLLASEVEAYIGSPGFWTAVGLNIAAWLITPCLTLGMYQWMLNRLRGRADEPVSTVFCRAKLFFKAIGLQLFIVLKVLLWMLPGIGLTFAGYIPILRAGNDAAALNSAIRLSNGLMLPSLLLTVVPGVMAALRYAMSEFIMADEPETGIRECVRRSIRHMQEMKRMLFTLMFSFLVWYLLGMILSTWLSAFGETFGLLVQMLVSLLLTVYISASEASFFLETAPGKIPKHTPVPEAPADSDDGSLN